MSGITFTRYSQNREIVMTTKFKGLGAIKLKSLNRIAKICERQLNDPCVYKYYASISTLSGHIYC
jgi:hypothetical protein